ncbi:2Fe-2S iron-sulfur cluster-binding protein [Actinoplanes derwentensis]|uniref:Sarcosine oxidase subunit alpha n=1 Tax=Actinoplanes derwentensis TaxID=113562 RepID=A0A1H2AKW1_9ACTN|nr:2Fe-2S iron-sulfur cluster-binding protein [Actinoplanes derwentensis]GID88796.1 sarcosine oxidase subunit alpha [Actinoplanes derwentensis]SDT46487.1 sarcosine oxidase subunit alpha [Actinoplanes derwentensis]
MTLRFTFDGREYQGNEGDTLASALLANGVHVVSSGIRTGRPRGIFAAGVEEPNAIVQIEEPFPEPMLTATTVELFDGLVVRGLRGQGRLADRPDPARYGAIHAHCDVLVIGAGPAGLAAAATAATSGARVILVDDQPQPGGSLLGTGELLDWVAATAESLRAATEVRVLSRTTAFGYYDDNHVIAVERCTAHLGAAAPADEIRERIWRIRAGRVVLATGAHERSIAFADNDRPGVMLAGAARTYVNRYGVSPGRRAVVLTTNDSAYAAALDLHAAGVEIAAIADLRGGTGSEWARRCAERGIEVLAGWAVAGVTGADRVSAVTLRALDGDQPAREEDADLLLVSGGWNPVGALFSQAGGRLAYDATLAAFRPDGGCRQAVDLAGAIVGTYTISGCLLEGAQAGGGAGLIPLPVVEEPEAAPPVAVWTLPGDAAVSFVDLQRDVTVADIARATGTGMRSAEHVKRYTTAGTAHDQGKTSGTLTSGVVAGLLGVEVGALGTTTFRPPYAPVSFAALAGRDRGMRFDPVRVTALHGWHESNGALFENVGQWKRPWYYPLGGEDMGTAVLRECRAAREGVAMMDASTLGKIDVRGPDAGVFLDRLYTNMISTLKPGAIRYGVMCRPDGMVLDDGTVIRLTDERFLVTTTTGNAALILDWMEEWLQTEWPSLRVRCTSVTEQWATVALVGPRSREILAGLAPELDVTRDGFPFMTWRDTTVAGIEARVCRISFSGELAYEINVSWWDALALWTRLAGLGVTPYGTETMHVLRAEKGYPIIGQDTDGTVTPHDLGLGWAVSKKKADFIGRRSFARTDNNRPDRKQLVGLLPDDGVLLPEGSHLLPDPELPEPPVTALGHVTSSYHSAALGRTFALALISNGRELHGQTLWATLDDRLVPVTVTGSVLYDPEGARRDG